MLPYAKCLCAKSLDFDENGDECYSDYGRLLKQVDDSGFRGWIEVEYEGPGHAGALWPNDNLPSRYQRPTVAWQPNDSSKKLLGSDLARSHKPLSRH